MVYKVNIVPSASKALGKLERRDGERIRDAIEGLAENPRPSGCLKMTGAPGWRIKVGSFRVVYEINDAGLIVIVVVVTDRKDAYKR